MFRNFTKDLEGREQFLCRTTFKGISWVFNLFTCFFNENDVFILLLDGFYLQNFKTSLTNLYKYVV